MTAGSNKCFAVVFPATGFSGQNCTLEEMVGVNDGLCFGYGEYKTRSGFKGASAIG